jgi:hypothetical protein
MFRSKTEILRDLDPTDRASIQALIEFHRRTFGGFVMEDKPGDSGTEEGKADQGKQDPPADGKDGDKPLGPNGEKALQAERDARQALETKVKQIEAETETRNKALLEAFGIKTEGAKPEDAVATLQQQFAALQRDNLVLRVAATHQITEKDDLDLLRATADEDTMTKLAVRLSKTVEKSEDDGKEKRRFPRQDSSQGKGGSGGEGRPGSVAEVMEQRAAARAAKQQQRSA